MLAGKFAGAGRLVEEALAAAATLGYGPLVAEVELMHGELRTHEGRYTDAEVAALLVSATRHLGDDEVVALARARSSMMTPVQWDEPIVVDKHSIGGVPGSRITLIVVPIVAAHGLAMPKTSSRAITSAAGTADAMETLARVDLTADEVRATVRRVRGCIAWNGRLNHSALDDVMNAITRPLGIDSNRWSVASILSKKLTAGSTHVIVDLPWGPQAKLRTAEEALELGQLFERVGAALGLVVAAHATDGSAPIGLGVGPALEVRDVLRVLDNDPAAPADLVAKAVAFAGRIIAWDPAVASVDKGRARALELLHSGAAREKFDEIVDAHGRWTSPARPSTLTHRVHAEAARRVGRIDIARISEIARRAGTPVDKKAGVDLVCGAAIFSTRSTPARPANLMAQPRWRRVITASTDRPMKSSQHIYRARACHVSLRTPIFPPRPQGGSHVA